MQVVVEAVQSNLAPRAAAGLLAKSRVRIVRLASLWPRLCSGKLVITAHSASAESCELRLRCRPAGLRSALRHADGELLAALLAGECQKNFAIDRGVSPSSISNLARRCLRRIGTDCTLTHAPLGLALVATAYRATFTQVMAVIQAPRSADEEWIVSMPRSDAALLPRLSAAEYEVARLAMEGVLHEDIAARRQRSGRTVANQLRSIGMKLGVSGRFRWIDLSVRSGAALARSLR